MLGILEKHVGVGEADLRARELVTNASGQERYFHKPGVARSHVICVTCLRIRLDFTVSGQPGCRATAPVSLNSELVF